MTFSATPSRNNAPSQLLSLGSILAATGGARNSGGTGVSPALSIIDPPTNGTVGSNLEFSGIVAPSGAAVQVGLSSSSTAAPSNWVAADVVATNWTAEIMPSASGTYFLWAEQSAANSVQSISPAVAITGAEGGTLSYSLINGSGNGSLMSVTLSSASASLAVDWTASIAAGATDVRPGVVPSSMGTIAGCKFWFDSSATNVTVPAADYGNAGSLNNDEINFYPFSAGYGTPVTAPAAPATPGTYFGKYAMYDSSNTLLGVFATSAITVT